MLSKAQKDALHWLKVYTAGTYSMWSLAGKAQASCRAHILSVLLGRPINQAKAGVSALESECYKMVDMSAATCDAHRERLFLNFAKENEAMSSEQVRAAIRKSMQTSNPKEPTMRKSVTPIAKAPTPKAPFVPTKVLTAAELEAMTPMDQVAYYKWHNAQLVTSVSRKPNSISLKVSEKGGVSAYGLGRFPVTLYKEQWERLLTDEQVKAIKDFIVANSDRLTTKA